MSSLKQSPWIPLMKIKIMLFFSLLVFSICSSAKIIDGVVAIVNSEVILQSDLLKMDVRLKKKSLLDEMLLPENPDLLFKKDRTAMIQYLISEKIMDSEVKRLNFSITSERVNQEIKDVAKRNNISTEEVLRSVTAEGISVAEYQHSLKTRIERQSVVESEIVSRLRISDEDCLAEFTKLNPGTHTGAQEYSISHIFFDVKKNGPEAALERANKVFAQLASGKNFETLVKQHSEDPSAASGGSLGTFRSGEFSSDFENAIKNLSAGQHSQVTKSRAGYHILKLNSVKSVLDPRFEKAKEGIRSRLLEKAFKRQLQVWLASKKDEAFIRINK